MTDVRIEKDLLGAKEVPKAAYYGIQTLRAVENFPITGIPPHVEMIRALAAVKKAAAIANMEVGVLKREIGEAITQASDEILAGHLHDQFIVDSIQGGAGTSMNMNANEVIANRAIEFLGGERGHYMQCSPNTHVNMAQSTNDVFPTAIRIASLNLAKGVIEQLELLHQAFSLKAVEFDQVIKMGRTHLQDAVPIRMGQEFEAYARVIGRDVQRVKRSLDNLREINMGATAVGTGLNADPRYIVKVTEHLRVITGLDLQRAEHLVDATQNTDAYTEVSGALKICAVNLSKICNDLRLMASGPRTGLGELELPPRQPGSSIMPGKVNPVMAEVVNQVAFQIIGNDHTISLASEAGQLELNVMEPVLVFNLLQSLSILQNALQVFRKFLVEGLKANVERCQELVEKSVGIVTAINPHVGYETATSIAKEAIQTGRSVRDICTERGVLTPEELDVILNPFEMTSPGISGAKLLFGE
ncbi:aspartate ammonia-lyase [Tumebacillus permanentifrigoris]|uniref:Aspartate ammonia-lyase n=1 Tax=Tumebacillus permanentifrigoris TaxID=378543 RepID=A0A316D857_9BACL|nr:aspartate ammonia-lyase [Tumebacillus permanentifrigoris]PWK06260.1 aspartate ammonia-lyase [Tumebacillus permanentifrigoris]